VNERVSILMILLILFLLIICNLIISSVNREILLSGENTFSGGLIRPSFLITPARFSNDKKMILIYKQGAGKSNEDDFVFGIPQDAFADILSFIDYGEINYNEKNYPVFQLKIIEEAKQGIIEPVIIGEDEEQGIIDTKIIENIISQVWPDYNYKKALEILPGWFNIAKRPKIYYESLSVADKKMILIGDFAIEVTNALTNNDKFLFDTMATSIIDFVYLGEFNLNKRIRFFENYGDKKAVDYYKKWNVGELKGSFSPFVKYPNICKKYIKTCVWENKRPPEWVKELFLDQIGVNLKVSTDKQQ